MVSQAVIKKCIKKDPISQQSLYLACAPYVYTIAKSYISDQEYIKDAMQDSFVAIFQSLVKYNEEVGTFKSWIAKITTYKCIDLLKANNKISFNTQLEAIENISEDSFAYLDNLSVNDIESMISNMPNGYKTIFLLSVIDGYTHKEIGEMVGISPETSRSQLHRALNWIKKNIALTSNQYINEAL